MKILCISDTHCKQDGLTIPNCDVLIVSGDVCSAGDIWEFENFVAWLNKHTQSFRKCFLIAGNHDWCLMRQKTLGTDILKSTFNDKVQYLEDSESIFEGIKFYGSPWQPKFCNWAFNLPRGEKLKLAWSNIPDDVDVLITHGPPHGIGDVVKGVPNTHVGCMELLNRVRELSNLKLHVFGHIHSSNGVYLSEEIPNCHFCNASICDESYAPNNSAYLFNIEQINNHVLINCSAIQLCQKKLVKLEKI